MASSVKKYKKELRKLEERTKKLKRKLKEIADEEKHQARKRSKKGKKKEKEKEKGGEEEVLGRLDTSEDETDRELAEQRAEIVQENREKRRQGKGGFTYGVVVRNPVTGKPIKVNKRSLKQILF